MYVFGQQRKSLFMFTVQCTMKSVLCTLNSAIVVLNIQLYIVK